MSIIKSAQFRKNLAVLICVALSACSARQSPAPLDSVYRGKTIYDYEPGSLNQSQYKVEKGDTLYSIAFRAGVDFKYLAKLNRISSPYAIFPGQIIKLDSSYNSKSSKKHPSTEKKNIKSGQKEVDPPKRQEYVVSQGKRNVTNVKKVVEDSALFNLSNWQWPANGKIIARFSYKELGNKGLEITGKRGDPIFAANSGKVVYAGRALRGYGNLIIIKHSDDYLSAYAHNQTILVKEKDWIKVGQHIADMGDTDSDRVKLRFEVRFKGNTVNPEKFLPKH